MNGSFKFLLLKIINIALYNFTPDMLLDTLVSNVEDYEELIND